MDSTRLNIITPCTRPWNLDTICSSLEGLSNIHWYVVFDFEDSKMDFSVPCRSWIDYFWFHYEYPAAGKPQINYALTSIKDGWVYVLDDDNIFHPTLAEVIKTDKILDRDLNAIIFNQRTPHGVRYATPSNTKECSIDQAQYMLKREYIGNERFNASYTGDGEFIERLYKKNPQKYLFINEALCYYNFLRNEYV